MRTILFLLSLTFASIFSKGQQRQPFIPDTTVNQIKINDYRSTERVLGKDVWKNLFESKGSLPRIEVVNNTKTESLRLIFHYGGSKNSVDEFEIAGIDKSYKIPKQAIVLATATFITGNNIRLGMSKEEVVKILGAGYKSNVKGKAEELLYTLNNKSGFVRRYNQYEYYIRCLFRNGVLLKYSFGFTAV